MGASIELKPLGDLGGYGDWILTWVAMAKAKQENTVPLDRFWLSA